MVPLPSDPELTDCQLNDEIELLADVMTAVSGTTSLSDAEIDSALGVAGSRGGSAHPGALEPAQSRGEQRPG